MICFLEFQERSIGYSHWSDEAPYGWSYKFSSKYAHNPPKLVGFIQFSQSVGIVWGFVGVFLGFYPWKNMRNHITYQWISISKTIGPISFQLPIPWFNLIHVHFNCVHYRTLNDIYILGTQWKLIVTIVSVVFGLKSKPCHIIPLVDRPAPKKSDT